MAFDELPKVDRSSVNSDESATRLQSVLSRAAGFILREDVPDYGCDFDVELIKENGQASNWRFPIQLKSIEDPDIVHDGKFVSYSFKTSRLGYLLRRQPSFGLVVLYNVNTKELYYDYADEIYSRLMAARESDEWKSQEKVNILIPISNVLSEESAKKLYRKFLSRFEQAALMQLSQGAKYGLPPISLEPKTGFDFNDLEDVKKALKKWGINLLMQFDLQIVFELVAILPSIQITSDKDICLIALITYSEVGKHADSVFYIERIRKKFELSEEDKRSVDFIEIKNQLRLGDITPKEYIQRTTALLPKVSESDSLMLKINILYFELAMIKALEPMPLQLGEEIQKLFAAIEEARIDELPKQYMKLWNADNLERWIGHFRNEVFAELQMRENMGVPVPLEERLEKAQRLVNVHDMFYYLINNVDRYAKQNNNVLLQAHTIKLLIRFELSFEIDQISHDRPAVEEREPKISKWLELAGGAFNTFLYNSLYHDAYQMLLYQIDLYYVGVDRYGFNEEFDIDGLLATKQSMEKELEFDGGLSVTALLARKQEKVDKGYSMEFLSGLNDGQLNTLAEIMMQSGKFPLAQKEHIVKQMKSYQLFNARCTNPNIVVVESLIPDTTAYAQPMKFVLKNTVTNMVSLPDTNMDKLLTSWGY